MPDTHQPAKQSTFRLRRRTPGSFLLVPCPKQGRSIRCQGQLEAAAATILVSCPAVAHVQEQPMSIWYQWRHDGNDLRVELLENHDGLRARNEKDRGCTYVVPDFLVDMHDGKVRLLEIKPSDRLDRPALPRKLAAMQLFAERQGWTFHLLTEKELICGPLLGNLRLIGRYRHARTDESLLNKLQQLVPEQGMPLANVIRCADDSDVGNATRARVSSHRQWSVESRSHSATH